MKKKRQKEFLDLFEFQKSCITKYLLLTLCLSDCVLLINCTICVKWLVTWYCIFWTRITTRISTRRSRTHDPPASPASKQAGRQAGRPPEAAVTIWSKEDTGHFPIRSTQNVIQVPLTTTTMYYYYYTQQQT